MRASQRATETGMRSPETGKFSTALRVSPPQSSLGATSLTIRSLDREEVRAAVTVFGRPFAEHTPDGVAEIIGRGPAEVAARLTFTGAQPLGSLALRRAEASTLQAFHDVQLSHAFNFGVRATAD
jgi:hypothetical protein